MPKPTIVHLSQPATLAAFGDLALMQRWEILRRRSDALSAHEYADACGIEPGAAQKELDRLLEAGLVVRLRASRVRRHIAYRSVSTEVMLVWNPDAPEERLALRNFFSSIRTMSRAILDRHLHAASDAAKPRSYFAGFASVMLTPTEIDAINRLLRSACEVLDSADARAEERARGEYAGDVAADTELPYHLAVELRPLVHPEPPIPHVELWDKRSVSREVERVENSAIEILSKRELEIARRLASGESRPIIAGALGLTANTVATICKRIHAKLGVHSRAELTARMRGV
jgi:DNA-binding CsgD family transcriptional regulator